MATSDLTWSLSRDLDVRVRARIGLMREQEVVRRMWNTDPTAWTGVGEDQWLGWLSLPMEQRSELNRAVRLANQVKHEEVSEIVLLGMGGSSLAPEVIRSVIGTKEGYPNLRLLDSTDPAQILALERQIDLRRTLFLVASKSGSTLEVNILKQYFFHRCVQKFGEAEAGNHFVLTTDPGSKLHQIAEQEHFRKIFAGVPTVGGRYSALSNFGIVPAALIGVDVSMMLDRAETMARRCATDGDENTAFQLGAILGELALAGKDKPTMIAPPALASFGAWLEQLIAESLGKHGKGIIPIDGEIPGRPEVYGTDRVFVHFRYAAAPDVATDQAAERLERAGHPIVRIEWPDRYALGAEFYRWEFATAIMGAVLGVNPFDQPDVEESKIVTRRLASEYERTGKLPEDPAVVREPGMSLHVDARNQKLLGAQPPSVVTYLEAFLGLLRPGDYFALLAFIEMNPENEAALQAIRGLVRDRRKVATSVGFGPRFLHSTGQAHKGGPNTGVFLQITCDDAEDVPVPGQRYSFGTIRLAQARGDFEVLSSRGRRLMRIHFKDIKSGLKTLRALVEQAVSS
jgi:transaldolase/glucose-6-phosphate isomerase